MSSRSRNLTSSLHENRLYDQTSLFFGACKTLSWVAYKEYSRASSASEKYFVLRALDIRSAFIFMASSFRRIVTSTNYILSLIASMKLNSSSFKHSFQFAQLPVPFPKSLYPCFTLVNIERVNDIVMFFRNWMIQGVRTFIYFQSKSSISPEFPFMAHLWVFYSCLYTQLHIWQKPNKEIHIKAPIRFSHSWNFFHNSISSIE